MTVRIRHLYRHLCIPALSAVVFLLAGCANSGPFSNIPNPFAPTASVTEVYFSQFPDVPIPRDMNSVAKETLVTPASDGTRFGLETFSGRVESYSLSSAMIHNLSSQGWSLRGSAFGKQIMQLHEKDNRYIVIHISEGPVNTEMAVWLVPRMQQAGLGQLTGQSSGAGGGTSVINQWEGGKSYPLNN